ncbi:MAG: imidazole glycerol phosphate synthase subunit HisF [Bacteroidota bacterium]
MLKKRIIPVILLRNGIIVQSRKFKRYQAIGSPTAAVERLSSWSSDELIYLDISSEPQYDLNRDDLNHPGFKTIVDIIELISQKCFMPLTFGGGIRTLDDIRVRIKLGADKITLNSAIFETPELVSEGAREFGAQCIVASIDVKREESGYVVYKGGRTPANVHPVELARRVQDLGAGEILLNAMDRDGAGAGFDLELINEVCHAVTIPVIAIGGAGSWSDFEEVLTQTKASAVAAANIFHHSENSVYHAKQHLYEKGYNVRKPMNLSVERKNL